MATHINTLKHIFLLLIINILIISVRSFKVKQSEQILLTAQPRQLQQQKYKIIRYHFANANKQCLLYDFQTYIDDGSYQYMGFYSDQKFTMIRQLDVTDTINTQFTECNLISLQELQKRKENTSKIFSLTYEYINEMFFPFIHDDDLYDENRKVNYRDNQIYYAELKIYGKCNNDYQQSIHKQYKLKIVYFDQDQSSQYKEIQNYHQQDKLQQVSHLVNHSLSITVYCKNKLFQIKLVNNGINKLYFIVIAIIFGILLNFKPINPKYFVFGLFNIIVYILVQFNIQTIYYALLTNIYVMGYSILISIIPENTKTFFVQDNIQWVIKLLLKSEILSISYLFFKTLQYQTDKSIQENNLYFFIATLTIVMGETLFISLMVNFTCFRYAFYYFITIVFAECYLNKYIRKLQFFSLMKLKVFSGPLQFYSLLFAMLIIPLCNFFFKSYSTEKYYKLLIILIPILADPFRIPYSLSFLIGIIIWIIHRKLQGYNLINMIKYKNQIKKSQN